MKSISSERTELKNFLCDLNSLRKYVDIFKFHIEGEEIERKNELQKKYS